MAQIVHENEESKKQLQMEIENAKKQEAEAEDAVAKSKQQLDDMENEEDGILADKMEFEMAPVETGMFRGFFKNIYHSYVKEERKSTRRRSTKKKKPTDVQKKSDSTTVEKESARSTSNVVHDQTSDAH
jgi:hypothetical protein